MEGVGTVDRMGTDGAGCAVCSWGGADVMAAAAMELVDDDDVVVGAATDVDAEDDVDCARALRAARAFAAFVAAAVNFRAPAARATDVVVMLADTEAGIDELTVGAANPCPAPDTPDDGGLGDIDGGRLRPVIDTEITQTLENACNNTKMTDIG